MTEEERARRWAAAYAERPRLLRMARRRTANDAEAEDCVSEAMLRCVEFEGLDEERVAAFLTTVTLRLCADQHRGRARLLRAGGHLVGRADEPSHEEAVCDRAEAAWLAGALDMSPHQRRVVEARAEGLSCEEVARRFGVSVDAVKSAAARVRGIARTAVARTLGTVPVPYGKVRGLLGGGAIAGAAAGLTLGGLLLVPPDPPEAARPRPWSAGPVEVERRAVPLPAHGAVTARPSSVGVEVPGVRRLLAPAPLRPAPDVDPVPEEVTVADLPNGDRVTRREEGASTPERLLQCVTEGITIGSTIECKNPEREERT